MASFNTRPKKTTPIDASIASPAEGELLVYDASMARWINTLTLTGAYTFSTQILLADDTAINFGTGSDVQLDYDSALDSFDINLSATADFRLIDNGNVKLQFDNSAELFIFENNVRLTDDTKLRLGASNDVDLDYDSTLDSFDINLSATADFRLRANESTKFSYDRSANLFIFTDNVRITDDDALFLGSSNDIELDYDSSADAFDIDLSATADFRLKAAGTVKLSFDQSADRFQFVSKVRLIDDITLTLGLGDDIALDYDSTNDSFDIDLSATADFRLLDNGTTKLSFDNSNDLFQFESNVRLTDDTKLRLGDSNDIQLDYDSTLDSFDINLSATADFRLIANGVTKFSYDTSADLFIFTDNVRITDNDALFLGSGNDIELDYDTAADAFDIDLSTTADFRLKDAGVVKLQFDNSADTFTFSSPITATSYGGILEANLLDKSATETITGSWTFSATGEFTSNLVIGPSGALIIEERSSAPSNLAGAGKLWVEDTSPTSLLFTDDVSGDQLIDPSISTINSKSSSYTLILSDKGKTIRATGTTITITIPANASVGFPTGTLIGIQNDGSGDMTIQITSDILRSTADGTGGTRTIATRGAAVIIKTSLTQWKISGDQMT